MWARGRQLEGRCSGSSAGFTLIELLISLLIGLVIFGAVLNLLVVGLHKQVATSNRVDSLQQARVGEGRLTRELRQSTNVSVTNAGSGVQYTLPIGTVVTWVCATGGTCTRTASGVASAAVTGVANVGSVTSPPFALAVNQVAIQLQLTVNTATYWLRDTVSLRNVAAP